MTVRRYAILYTVLATAGALLVLFSTSRYGPGLSPDSAGYLSAARNLMKGRGLITFLGVPLVNQPPLYPAVLAALGSLFRADPAAVSRILQAVLFGTTIALAGALFRRHLPGFLASLGGLVVLVARPLLANATMTWSEPLFILSTLAFLLGLERYLERPGWRRLLLTSASAALAWLTRYIGATLIATGLFALLFLGKDRRARRSHLAVYLLVTLLPVVVWSARNRAISGTLAGPRYSTIFPFLGNLAMTFYTFLAWTVSPWITAHRTALLLSGAAAGYLAALAAREGGRELRRSLGEIRVVLFFGAVYLGALITLSTLAAYDPIGDRLLSPLYVPAALLILVLVRVTEQQARRSWRRPAADLVVLVPLVFWLGAQGLATAHEAQVRRTEGAGGFARTVWKESTTLRFVEAHTPEWRDTTLICNVPEILYLLDEQTTRPVPQRRGFNSYRVVATIEDLQGSWPGCPTAILVWFRGWTVQHLFQPEELATAARLDTIMRCEDGVVFRVAANP